MKVRNGKPLFFNSTGRRTRFGETISSGGNDIQSDLSKFLLLQVLTFHFCSILAR